MKGTVKNLVAARNFGFIRGSNNGEYFFHRDDFNGHWDDLVEDLAHQMHPEVSFDVVESPKGLRAANVRRNDWPNES